MVNSFGTNLLYFLHFNKTLRVLFVCHCCKMATQQLERGKFLLKKKLLNSCCNQIFRVLTMASGLTPFFTRANRLQKESFYQAASLSLAIGKAIPLSQAFWENIALTIPTFIQMCLSDPLV